MEKTLVLVCTYNEAENIQPLLKAITSAVPAADLLVIDDASPDGTGELVQQLQSERSGPGTIHLLRRGGKEGLGTAFLTGARFAFDGGYQNLVNLDADFSHPPAKIPELIDAMTDHDVVIGSRYVRGGEIEGWGLIRKMLSWGVNFVSRWWLWLPTHDNSGAFRCYRVPFLDDLLSQRLFSKGYSFTEEVLYRLHRRGGRFREVPIKFVNRQRGSSKLDFRELCRSFWTLIMLPMRA